MSGSEIETLFGVRHPISAATHLAWCFVSAFVAARLVRQCRGDRVKRVSVACFGVSMVVLYGVSALFHSVPAGRPDLVRTFRLLDFSAIYLLIAGSYTPAFAVLLTGRLRVAMLAWVWGLAAIGSACKWLLPLPLDELSMALYIATGLAGFLPARALVRAVGPRPLLWALAGCVCYSVGGMCDALHGPVLVPGWVAGHEMLHLLDICGTLTHVFFVARYVVPFRREEASYAAMAGMDAVRGG